MSTASKTFLFTTWEGGGNIPPVITLARRLREQGYRVRLMCDEASREDAEAAGIVFHPWAPRRIARTRRRRAARCAIGRPRARRRASGGC